MFKQFAQFNRNALQGGGGSGLGLWICKNLAAFHGGRLVRIFLLLTVYIIHNGKVFLLLSLITY